LIINTFSETIEKFNKHHTTINANISQFVDDSSAWIKELVVKQMQLLLYEIDNGAKTTAL
jgi:hypothetical protein